MCGDVWFISTSSSAAGCYSILMVWCVGECVLAAAVLFMNIKQVPCHSAKVDGGLNFVHSIFFYFFLRKSVGATVGDVATNSEQTECDPEEQCELDGPLFHFVTVFCLIGRK